MNEPEIKKLQIEWTLLNAIREMKSISYKGFITPTYRETLEFARIIAPRIFDEESLLMSRLEEPELVRKYKQEAIAQSQLKKRKISAEYLIDQRIESLTKEIEASTKDSDLLRKELNQLHRIKYNLREKKYSEDQLLHRDLHADRIDLVKLPLPQPFEKFVDFQAAYDRVLRVRLLHPDKPEATLGTDVVYEQYHGSKKMLRFIHIQYKIWNGRTLYWSTSKNLEKQLENLDCAICKGKFCNSEKGKNPAENFRLPYCSAFLRPTTELQNAQSRLISSGLHVPICKIPSLVEKTDNGNNKLSKFKIRTSSFSQRSFEEAFNNEMLGSRWLGYDEVEHLYRKHSILDSDEKIILHAQEFGTLNSEKKHK